VLFCFLTNVSRDNRCRVSWGRGVGGWLNRSNWLNLMHILSISVVDLLADLLGESEVNSLASRSSKLGDALLFNLNIVHDLWDNDALFGSEVLTADDDQVDGLVDTSLDWLGVGNLNCWLNRGNNGDIVASLLRNLLAVVVSVAVVSISWGWLTDSDHLGVAHLLVRNLNSFGGGSFSLLLVRVGADLIVNDVHTFSTDSTGDWVALLYVNDDLGGNLNVFTDSLESRGANLSRFNNINNRAVVLWLFISVMRLVVCWGMDNSMMNWGMVNGVVNWGMVNGVVNWGMVNSMVNWCMVNSMVNWGMDSMMH